MVKRLLAGLGIAAGLWLLWNLWPQVKRDHTEVRHAAREYAKGFDYIPSDATIHVKDRNRDGNLDLYVDKVYWTHGRERGRINPHFGPRNAEAFEIADQALRENYTQPEPKYKIVVER